MIKIETADSETPDNFAAMVDGAVSDAIIEELHRTVHDATGKHCRIEKVEYVVDPTIKMMLAVGRWAGVVGGRNEDEIPVAKRDPRDVKIDELTRAQGMTDRKLNTITTSMEQLIALVGTLAKPQPSIEEPAEINDGRPYEQTSAPIARTRRDRPSRTPEMAPPGGYGEMSILGTSAKSTVLVLDPNGGVDADGNPRIIEARLPKVGDTLTQGTKLSD